MPTMTITLGKVAYELTTEHSNTGCGELVLMCPATAQVYRWADTLSYGMRGVTALNAVRAACPDPTGLAAQFIRHGETCRMIGDGMDWDKAPTPEAAG